MARLRHKVWEDHEENPLTMEKGIELEKSSKNDDDHSLINIDRDLMKIETDIRPIRKTRANQTSVNLLLLR